MADTSERRAVGLTQNSYVSIGLVVTLVLGAAFYGRQLQRLDAIEAQLKDVGSEVRELRTLVLRQSTGR